MAQGHATSFARVYEEAVRERLIAAALHDSDPAGVGSAVEGRPKSAGSLSAVEQQTGIERETEPGAGTQNAGSKCLLASEAAVKDRAAEGNGCEPRYKEDDDLRRQDEGETRGSPDPTSRGPAGETGSQRTGSPEYEVSRNSPLDVTSPQYISSDEEVGELHDAEENEMAALLARMRETDRKHKRPEERCCGRLVPVVIAASPFFRSLQVLVSRVHLLHAVTRRLWHDRSGAVEKARNGVEPDAEVNRGASRVLRRKNTVPAVPLWLRHPFKRIPNCLIVQPADGGLSVFDL